MYIDKNSVIIDGVIMAPYISSAKFGWHKLWGKDTGRNLAGKNKGTLVGIFPKITLNFRPLTQAEVELLAPILDSVNQTTEYYDPRKKDKLSISTYAGDWEQVYEKFERGNSFSCAFIANEKRRL